MKRFFLATVMAVISFTAFAQSGKWAAGLNVGYGSDISKPFIGTKVLYDINSKWTIAPSFNYYFKDTESFRESGVDVETTLKCWDANFDLHWNLISKDNFRFYPLAGLTYLHAKAEGKASAEGAGVEADVDASVSDGKFGANLGIGGQLNIASNWAVGLEVKYQFIDASQFVPALTVMYRF